MNTSDVVIGGRLPRHGKGDTLLDVPDNATGFWLFNRPTGATDDEARETGMRNRVPGAANGPQINRFPGTLPTVFDDYWRFAPDGPLLTAIPETADMTMMAFARSMADGIADDAQARPYIIGSYGNTLLRGFGIEMHSADPVRARAVAYDELGVRTNQITMEGSHQPWRIYRAYVSEGSPVGELSLANLTGDGATPTPNPTPLEAARAPGVQTVSIGARLAPGSSAYTKSCDVAMAMTVAGLWDTEQQALMLAQFRRQIALTALTEGAV